METEPPRLRAQTARLVRLSAAAGALVSWLEAVLAAITIGMAMLPEEFPVVLAVFMAMGAWRISRARVLTRRAAPSRRWARHLCTDKTGTLTENRMSIAELRPGNGNSFGRYEVSDAPLPEDARAMALYGLLASAPEPFDPMDIAFHDLAKRITGGVAAPHAGWTLAHSYGLRSGLLAVTHVWQAGAGKPTFTVAAKGVPETIAELCRLAKRIVPPSGKKSMQWRRRAFAS